MSGILCTCPPAAAITTLTLASCPEQLGQVTRLIFQRVYTTGTTKNEIADAATLKLKATWTALIAAINGTKAQASPVIHKPEFETGDVKEYGGDNDTAFGVPVAVGRDNSKFSADLLNEPASVIRVLKEYECEELGVYLVNSNGQIGCITDSTGTKRYPIPVQSLFISDKQAGGFSEPDKHMLKFQLKPNWSDYFVLESPSFDPNTDI
jgi:hypothetical protein